MMPLLPVLLIAYLLGSVPYGYILVLVFARKDVRTEGSGNIGATNVARAGGKKLGLLTLLLDSVKGAIAVLIAFQVGRYTGLGRDGSFDLATLAGLAAMVGHVFPVWLRFRGGKGVATALGVFLVLSPPAALCALLAFILVFLMTKRVSLASIIGAALMPVFVLLFAHHVRPLPIAAFCCMSLLVIAKHHANIARLIAGTEPTFSSRKKTEGAGA